MAEKLVVEWPHAVAGCIAGVATVVTLHPLDVIKTRMQVQDGKGSLLPRYKGTLHCLSTIWKREGIAGLYAGLAPCLIASGISWGLYFLLYNRSKTSWRNPEDTHDLSLMHHLLSGIEAGAITTLMTNPIWVLKTRFQLQEARRRHHVVTSRVGSAMSGNYGSLRHAIVKIAREEGIRGFYRGLGPSLLMCANAAIQFAIYEELRRLVVFVSDGGSMPSGAAFVIGGISKATASIITYPTQMESGIESLMLPASAYVQRCRLYSIFEDRLANAVRGSLCQVLRSRLQQRFDIGRTLKYTSLRHAALTTFQREGIKGLYKGLVPNVLRVMPQASLMFMVYEKTIEILKPYSGTTPMI